MVEIFPKVLAKSKTLAEVSDSILMVLDQLRKKYPDQVIAYVAGAITADGFDKIIENSRILAERARKIRKVHTLTFSAPDIFSQEVYGRINGLALDQADYKHFFRRKLRSGNIDLVYMTPGWRRSSGSWDEYETSTYLGIHIVDMESDPVWRWIDLN